jgi:hypothetical protein
MNACLSSSYNLHSVKSQPVQASRIGPPAVSRFLFPAVPSGVPSEALHACAFASPRVSCQLPISPGVSFETTPSEFLLDVKFEALPVHSYRAPREVLQSQFRDPFEGLHSQSGAPTEGPSDSLNISVPPEAAKGSAINPIIPPSEAPPTPSNAPLEAPLNLDVLAVTPSDSSNSSTAFCTDNPSSSPSPQLHAQDPRSTSAASVKSRHLPSLSQDTSEHSARLAPQKLIDTAAGAYQSAANWAEFVTQYRDARGDLHHRVGDLPHRAAHLLDQLRRHGAPVGMNTEPWDDKKKRDALQRGSHQSALQHEGFFV